MARERAALTVHDLSFSYPEYPGLPARTLLSHVSFELPRGEISLLLGAPDSGKTTLCRIIVGLVPRFSGGELTGDVQLSGPGPGERAPYELIEQVGLVFQNPVEQLFGPRCDAEVAFALESLGRSRPEIVSRVDAALRWMGLEGMAARDPLTLSGGEKKKLLLSCLHALEPPVWLLDETLEELDGETRIRLLDYLKKEGRTALVTSAKWHEMFARYVDRLLILEGGVVEPLGDRDLTGRLSERLLRMGLLLREGARDGTRAPAVEKPGDGAGKGGTPDAGAQGSRSVSASRAGGPLLAARGLAFRYPGSGDFHLAVSDLEVRAGEIVAVIGANGSGKTTLGRILCGLLEPEAGRVETLQEGGFLPATAEQLNLYTGYLFQDPDLQIFLPTVADELGYGLRLRALGAAELEARVDDAIERFRLPGAAVPPALMSYGARKRLQAAICFLQPRPLLVVDEGDSGLGASEFAELLAQLHAPERGLVFITHDLELARGLADRVLRMREGVLE
jgi:energy-coupling factor transporter ATP-binding protein EcfA2